VYNKRPVAKLKTRACTHTVRYVVYSRSCTNYISPIQVSAGHDFCVIVGHRNNEKIIRYVGTRSCLGKIARIQPVFKLLLLLQYNRNIAQRSRVHVISRGYYNRLSRVPALQSGLRERERRRLIKLQILRSTTQLLSTANRLFAPRSKFFFDGPGSTRFVSAIRFFGRLLQLQHHVLRAER